MSLSNQEMARLGELLDEALTLTPEQRCVWLDSLSSCDQPLVRTLRERCSSRTTGASGPLDRPPRIETGGGEEEQRPPAKRASGSAPTSCCGRWDPAAWRTSGSPAAPMARSSARWR